MDKLNNEQYRAVTHGDGPMLVLAGPGSGKTYVLIRRVEHLITVRHVPPENILVLTFSKEAAATMQSRFFSSNSNLHYPVSFGTFHAVFYNILKSCGYCRDETILNPEKKRTLLRNVARRKNIPQYNDISWLNKTLGNISLKKNSCNTELDKLNRIEYEQLCTVYDPYIELCRSEGVIDFDDMISKCLKLLKQDSSILGYWQNKFKYICVDEFQDIDPNQYEIMMLLAGNNQNLFCVGDDDQSIYSFRGANPELMRRFREDTKSCLTVNLKVNYRCAERIVNSAASLIAINDNRLDKEQECRLAAPLGDINYRCFGNREAEVQYVLSVVESLLHNEPDNSIGILYRANAEAELLEERFRLNGIQYNRTEGSHNYYGKEWIQDILAYFRVAIYNDRASMIRILNKPERNLVREAMRNSEDCFASLIRYYREDTDMLPVIDRVIAQLDYVKKLNPFAGVNYILNGIGLKKYIEKTYFEGDSIMLSEAVNELLTRAKGFTSVERWLDYVQLNDDESKSYNKNAHINMMTVHASKGLEFDNCIIIGLQEGVFPVKMADTKETLEEERRLFYVAMTRAKNKLWLIGRRMDELGKRESRFIAEALVPKEEVIVHRF